MPSLPDRLQTRRLVLERWRPAQAAVLRALIDENDAHLRPWIPFMQRERRADRNPRTGSDPAATVLPEIGQRIV